MNHDDPISTTEDAVDTAKNTWEKTKDKASEAVKSGQRSTEAAAEHATEAWEATKDKASEAMASGEQYVRDNPGTSVLGVFGAGVLVGVLVGWSMAHENEDRYTSDARKLLKRWGHKLNLD